MKAKANMAANTIQVVRLISHPCRCRRVFGFSVIIIVVVVVAVVVKMLLLEKHFQLVLVRRTLLPIDGRAIVFTIRARQTESIQPSPRIYDITEPTPFAMCIQLYGLRYRLQHEECRCYDNIFNSIT